MPGAQTPKTAFFFTEVRWSVNVCPLRAGGGWVRGPPPPLSLGPPVVRPLRMTVVRPFGKRTLTVLPHAGAVASSRTRNVAANFLKGSSPYFRGGAPER